MLFVRCDVQRQTEPVFDPEQYARYKAMPPAERYRARYGDTPPGSVDEYDELVRRRNELAAAVPVVECGVDCNCEGRCPFPFEDPHGENT